MRSINDREEIVCSPPIKIRIPGCHLAWNRQWKYYHHCHRSLSIKQQKKTGDYEKDGTSGDFTTIPNGCAGVENMYPYVLAQAGAEESPSQGRPIMRGKPGQVSGLSHRRARVRAGVDLVRQHPQKNLPLPMKLCMAIRIIPFGKAC